MAKDDRTVLSVVMTCRTEIASPCPLCLKPIAVGETIQWHKAENKVVHRRCQRQLA